MPRQPHFLKRAYSAGRQAGRSASAIPGRTRFRTPSPMPRQGKWSGPLTGTQPGRSRSRCGVPLEFALLSCCVTVGDASSPWDRARSSVCKTGMEGRPPVVCILAFGIGLDEARVHLSLAGRQCCQPKGSNAGIGDDASNTSGRPRLSPGAPIASNEPCVRLVACIASVREEPESGTGERPRRGTPATFRRRQTADAVRPFLVGLPRCQSRKTRHNAAGYR